MYLPLHFTLGCFTIEYSLKTFSICNTRIQFKTAIYLSCCMAEDELNQKRGTVMLFYFNSHVHTARRVLQRESHLSECLPIRFAAGHVCYNDPRLRVVNSIFMLVIGRERRVRLRTHEGTMERSGRILRLSFLVTTSDTFFHSRNYEF